MTDERSYFRNGHNLYVLTGLAMQNNLDDAMRRLFERIRDEFPDDGFNDAYYKANVIYIKDPATGLEGPVGYGYAWVSDTRIYNMMIGLNPDGTPRVEEIPDPEWVPPATEEEVEETADELADMLIAAADEDESPSADAPKKKYTTVGLSADGKLIVPSADELADFGFGDAAWDESDHDRVVAEYEEMQREERAKKFVRPTVRRQIGPIMAAILPGFVYTPAQSAAHLEILREEAVARGLDPATVQMPRSGYFIVESSYVRSPDDGYSKTEIFCADAPTWITEKMIEENFKRFNTDDSVYYGEVDSFRREFTYPRIKMEEIVDKRSGQKIKRVTVSFSPNSPHDAAFALQMCRKVEFRNPSDDSKVARLIFNRSIDAKSDAGRRILEDRRTKAIERQRDRTAGGASRPAYTGPRRMTSDSWQKSSVWAKDGKQLLVRESLDQESESRRAMIIPSSAAIFTSDLDKSQLTQRRAARASPPRPSAFDRDSRQRPATAFVRPGARQEPRPAAGGAGTASPQRPQLGGTIPEHIAPRTTTVVPKPTPAPWAKNKK
jgi:hypothetical protein